MPQFDIQQRTNYMYTTFTYKEVKAIPQSKEYFELILPVA